MVKNAESGDAVRRGALNTSSDQEIINPLDQLSSADIAVHIARMVRLDEATSVVNHADSVNAQLTTASSDANIISKPQVISTTTKTRKDIQRYIAKAGDTVSSLGTRFGVTSDTIRWSNGLSGENIQQGKELWISPINGIVYVVREGDTPESLAQRYRANKDAIIAFNDAELTGLPVGERIVIPDGVQPTPVRRSTAYASYGFAFGNSAIYGYNGYDYGWCTWWAAKRRADIGRPIPANFGNACNWLRAAQRAGIATGGTPAAGAVIFTKSGCLGHVGFVEQVLPDGSAWVSDMNSRGQVSPTDPRPAGGWNRVSWRLVTPDQFSRYAFIY